MVIGDRLSSTYFSENKRAFHGIGNRLVRKLINIIFKSRIRDVMTGSRAFSYDFVRGFPLISKGFEIETELTIHALDKNYKIEEMAVPYRDRPEGSTSKLSTVRDGARVLKTIATLFKEYKPMSFFAMCALFPFIFALILVIPVLKEYFETGLVPRFPSLIASGVFLMVSLLMLVCGIILDVVNKKQRQIYELIMNQDL